MKKLNVFLASLVLFGTLASTNVTDLKKNEAKASITFSEDLSYYNKYVGQEMLDAIVTGKLITPAYIKNNIQELANKGYCSFSGTKAYASRPLLDLLHALVTSKEISSKNPFSILSLFRKGRNHGAYNSGVVICRAVDIDTYSGHKIHMNTPHESLKAIVKVIKTMPEGRYNIGLPRPGGGHLIDPAKDFFLPVTSLSQNERSPTGTLAGDLKLIKNPEAKTLINSAIKNNKKAEVLYLMPDAVDHLHIKALDDGTMS